MRLGYTFTILSFLLFIIGCPGKKETRTSTTGIDNPAPPAGGEQIDSKTPRHHITPEFEKSVQYRVLSPSAVAAEVIWIAKPVSLNDLVKGQHLAVDFDAVPGLTMNDRKIAVRGFTQKGWNYSYSSERSTAELGIDKNPSGVALVIANGLAEKMINIAGANREDRTLELRFEIPENEWAKAVPDLLGLKVKTVDARVVVPLGEIVNRGDGLYLNIDPTTRRQNEMFQNSAPSAWQSNEVEITRSRAGTCQVVLKGSAGNRNESVKCVPVGQGLVIEGFGIINLQYHFRRDSQNDHMFDFYLRSPNEGESVKKIELSPVT